MASGLASGSTKVTITGSGFTAPGSDASPEVSFGSNPATHHGPCLDNQLTAVVSGPGSDSAGPVTVTVATTVGGSNATGALQFRLPRDPAAAPTVADAVPTRGPVIGGAPITVTGSGFTGATGVIFGSANAPSFLVVSDAEVVGQDPRVPLPGRSGRQRPRRRSRGRPSAAAGQVGEELGKPEGFAGAEGR